VALIQSLADAFPVHAPAVSATEFRRTLAEFASGVTVVTTLDPERRPYGVTATSFSSLSLDPPLIQWSLKRAAWSYPLFARGGGFAVNILAAGQEDVSRTFATRDIDRFAVTPHRYGAEGYPLIEGALAWLECALEAELPGGDHGILVGRVLRAATFEREPLLHWRGRYGALAGEAS
jgi:flavin reductase (DIM6/NTAB) family NADH-FMN oxidoreductase RutF